MVTFENVKKSFENVTAVDGISFEVTKGENAVLLGTSGCGKTTTLRMINRLTDPTSGTIKIGGENIKNIHPVELRRHIGYVLQNHGLFPHYTVAENIAIVPELLRWPRKKTEERITELLEQVALPQHYKTLFPQQLSGGQQQRVGIARALAADPPLLLMDEPFGALDAITRRDISKEFATLEILKSKTVIMVTHDIREAFDMGDKLLLMNKGKIVQAGSPTELLFHPKDPFITDFFRGQKMQLELNKVYLHDIWNSLPDETSEASSTEAINESFSLWEAITFLNNQAGNSITIKNSVTNEVKYAAFNTLFDALKSLKIQRHE